MVPLMESPLRHIVIDEAQWLPEPVIHHILDVLSIAGVTGWLLYEPPMLAYLPEMITDLFGGLVSHHHAAHLLNREGPANPGSHGTPAELLSRWDYPVASDGACPHPTRIHCLGRSISAAISVGEMSAEEGRNILTAVPDKRSTTVEEQWALRDFGQDTYTPALDALRQILPSRIQPHSLLVEHVAADGSAINAASRSFDVPTHMRAALRRQRHHSVYCNGPGDYPYLTIFDSVTEVRRRPARAPRADEQAAVLRGVARAQRSARG